MDFIVDIKNKREKVKIFFFFFLLFLCLSKDSFWISYMQYLLLYIYKFFYSKKNWTLSIIHWFILVRNSWLWVHSGGRWSHDWIVDVFFVVASADNCLGIWASLFFPHFVVFNVEILTLWVFDKLRVTKGFLFKNRCRFSFFDFCLDFFFVLKVD